MQQTLDDAQLHGEVEALCDRTKHKGAESRQQFMLPSEWMSSDSTKKNGDFKERPLHEFFRRAVQHCVYDFGRATRDCNRGEHSDGADAEPDEIMELMSLDSDPEVFDALLHMRMPHSPAGEGPLEECTTPAECHAMVKHFSFNFNPAITSAIQRIVGGRSEYDEDIQGHRNKTPKECVGCRLLTRSVQQWTAVWACEEGETRAAQQSTANTTAV